MSSLAELERDWSVDDVAVAHDLLDELEWAEGEAYRRAREEAEHK